MRGSTQVPAEYGVPRTLARLEALPRRPLLRDRGTAALTAARWRPTRRLGPVRLLLLLLLLLLHGQMGSAGQPPPSLSPCDRAQVLPRAASAAASRERAAPEQGGLPPAAPPPSGGQGALSAVEQHGATARPGMHPGLRRLHLPRVAARQPQRDRTTRGAVPMPINARVRAYGVLWPCTVCMTARPRALGACASGFRPRFRTFLCFFSL